MICCEISHQHDHLVQQLCFTVVLAIVQQVACNMSELQGDSFRSKDCLHLAHPVLVSHQPVQQGASLHGNSKCVLRKGSWSAISVTIPPLMEQHSVQHRNSPSQLRPLQGCQ